METRIRKCQNILNKCRHHKRSKHLYLHLFEAQLNTIVREEIIDKFLSFFNRGSDGRRPSYSQHRSFLDAVEFLSESCKRINDAFSGSEYKELKQKFFNSLRTHILSQKPYHLNDHLDITYKKAFRCFMNLQSSQARRSNKSIDIDDDAQMNVENEDDNEQDDMNFCNPEEEEYPDKQLLCHGCGSLNEECDCESLNENYRKMNEFLRSSDLLEGLVGDTVMNVSRTFIERRVSIKGKSNYSQSYLDELELWVHDVVKRWISEVYDLSQSDYIINISHKLDQFLKDAYAEVRVSHMFEIIIEYPNSEAAIQDLKVCIDQSTTPNFRLNLIDSVKQSLIESLLHPGVNTYDILTAYISAIKALRALDPTGIILQLVTEPVRRYLKSRDDTVRCIVTALTDEDHNSELNREMIMSSNQTRENGGDGKTGAVEMNLPDEGEKCTMANFEKWKPDPIKLSNSDDLMKSSRFSDIVSILVNIYETKDLFVEEYQKLLSQRLLNKYDECNLDTELRNLELLTLRFADCELHRCEVMLKDVQTSKRINKRILSGDIRQHKLTDFSEIDVLIISSPFWPEKFSPMASLSDETPEIVFPAEIESAIQTYTQGFEAIQASRTLHWRHHLGFVNMDLTVNGKTQNFTVSPLHASIIYLFKEKKVWKLNELMHRTSLPAATLRSRLALWQRNGLIRDTGEDRYELILE